MKILSTLLAAVVLTTLTACLPTFPPPTTTSPTPTAETPGATVTPEPTEPTEPVAATILITTSLLLVNDAEGSTIAHFDYFGDPIAAIEAFTEFFGGDPVVTPFEGSNHSWPGNYYTWDGFTIIDHVGGPGIPFGEDFAVRTTAGTVRGIQVETVADVTIGSTSAAVVAAGGFGGSYEYDGTTYAWLELDHVTVDSDTPESLVFVYVTLSGVGGTVTQLAAPAANWGP